MDFTGKFVKARHKNRSQFDALVYRCHKQAFNVAFRLTGNTSDAEDLTQEAFLRAYRFFDRYNENMPFENWLFRIMHNVFIDELRRRPKVRVPSSKDADFNSPKSVLVQTISLDQPINHTSSGDSDVYLEIPDSTFNPECLLVDSSLNEQLQEALNSLPEEFRIAVVLADIKDMSYEEIAQTMGCSLGTVRSRLHRGRRLLRQKLNVGALPEGAPAVA